MKVVCVTCGNVFDRKPCKVKDKNYCSKECWYNSGATRPARRTGEYKTCSICGKEIYVIQSRLVGHKNYYCSTKCKGIASRAPLKICAFCGKEFYVRGNETKRKYCSRQCSANSRKKGKIIKCEWCGKEVYKPKSHLDNIKNHFCSLKCANEYQGRNKVEYRCKTCGKIFRWSKSRVTQANPTYCTVECRNKDPQWILNACIKANRVQQKKKGLNNLELKGRKILQDIGIKFDEQVLLADKFLVDVLVPSFDLVIQWDGDYWHCHPRFKNPDKRQQRRAKLDKSQDAYLKKCGYKVLRFWESEVKKEVAGESDYIRRTIRKITNGVKGVV